MQFREEIGVLLVQALAQDVGEEVMVTIPSSLIVERDHEQVCVLEALQRMETGPFFQAVRGHTVVALYNNKNVWPNFGYQGSSAQDGGYRYRGFQDAGWTMQPDAEASPPPYLG